MKATDNQNEYQALLLYQFKRQMSIYERIILYESESEAGCKSSYGR